jgi:pilus assembly protein CpaF
MSRLQQGISKLNSLNTGGGASSISRLSSPSTGPGGGGGKNFDELKRQIHSKLVERLDFTRVKDLSSDAMRRDIRRVIEHLCDTENPLLNRIEREKLIEEVLDETLGFGPLEILLKDPTISDILVNGPHKCYVERRGKLEKTDVKFRDNDHLLQIIDRIVSKIGRRVDETSPMVDARLPDGSRVNAVIPPIALDGPSLSIRRFGANPLKLEDLLNYKAFTPEMAMLMEACIKARLNVLISGGTGCGKTTLLNTLSSFIPGDERVVTIEDAAELQLQQDHVVRLETRPPNIEGKGQVSTRDCVRNALRMRPERIIIGEVRGSEALDMLQAMNTGHGGSLATLHANTPREDHDGRVRAPGEGHAAADQLGHRPDHPGQPAPGRSAKDHPHHGSDEHGAGHHHHAGSVPVQAARDRPERPRVRPVRGHRGAAHVHQPARVQRRQAAQQHVRRAHPHARLSARGTGDRPPAPARTRRTPTRTPNGAARRPNTLAPAPKTHQVPPR